MACDGSTPSLFASCILEDHDLRDTTSFELRAQEANQPKQKKT